MMNKTQIAVVSSLIAALILPTFTSYAQTHPLEVPPKAQNRAQSSRTLRPQHSAITKRSRPHFVSSNR